MAMVTYMDDYRKSKLRRSSEFEEPYGEEVMYVGWNPMVVVSAMTIYQRPQEQSPRLPDDLRTVDVDAFLDRIYALASQG